jgi:hypothetical protein
VIKSNKLKTYAILSQQEEGFLDALTGLAPFFTPIIQEFQGTVFNKQEFASKVRGSYGWKFTEDIAEELVSRFEGLGWISQAGKCSKGRPIYIYNNIDLPELIEEEKKAMDLLSEISQQFLEYYTELSPLNAESHTQDELAEVLLKWLIAYESVFYAHEKKPASLDGKKTLTLDTGEKDDIEISISSEESYACARFVQHLHDSESELFESVLKITEVAFLTEVVQDFYKPTTQKTKVDLDVYLDTPVAMELMGLCGKQAKNNAEFLIDNLRVIGCRIGMYQHCVEELRDNIKNTANEKLSLKWSHKCKTAAAIRKRELLHDYVVNVFRNTKKCVESFKITIKGSDLNAYPYQHDYFTLEDYDNLKGAISWHQGFLPKERDAKSVVFTMRKRGGVNSVDAFQTKALLITRNYKFFDITKSFVERTYPETKNQIPPVVLVRQMATIAWLRNGLNTDEKTEFSRMALLSSCERVLQTNEAVVKEARDGLLSLSDDEHEQLLMLLEEPKSCRVLMDKTLGSSGVINSTNLSEVMEEMKSGLIDDHKEETQKTITSINAKHEDHCAELGLEISSQAKELDELRQKSEEQWTRLISRASTKYRMNQRLCLGLYAALVCLLGALPVAVSVISDSEGATLITLLIFALTLGFARFHFKESPKAQVDLYAQRLTTGYINKKANNMFGFEISGETASREIVYIDNKVLIQMINVSNSQYGLDQKRA